MATTPINSLINLGVPAKVPDGFTNLEVRAAVELMMGGLNNFLREFEYYVGATQKDVTTWDSIIPSDTLRRHQMGRLYGVASVNLAFGDFINLFNNAGILNFRKADASAGINRAAHGYVNISGGILAGEIGEVILSQGMLVIAGVSPGQQIYLSTTPGLASTVPATGAGQTEQFIGIGVATNLVYIDISLGQYIQH